MRPIVSCRGLVTRLQPARPRILLLTLLVGLAGLAAPTPALAIPYTLSGTALWTSTSPYSAHLVTGSLELGDPTLVNMGPEAPDGSDRYRVTYGMDYAFWIGSERLAGRGYMTVDAHGCGLFDCNFAAPITDNLGNAGLWTADNGAFFHADRTPYPDMLLNSLQYAQAPGIIEFYGADLNTRGFADKYFFREPLVATRAAGVPEPSTLLLLGAGLAGLVRRSYRKAHPTA